MGWVIFRLQYAGPKIFRKIKKKTDFSVLEAPFKLQSRQISRCYQPYYYVQGKLI